VRLHLPLESPGLASVRSVSLRRVRVVLHRDPGDRQVEGKKRLRLRSAPQPAPSSDVIGGRKPEASKLETERRKVAIHSIHRDIPGVGPRRVIALRLKPAAG
jgi:hypothetical protein